MLLLDVSQIALAAVAVHTSRSQDFSPDMVRHMVLNSIRATRMRFKQKYGELIVCCDNKDSEYWRKTKWPYYKSGRKKSADSKVNWAAVYEILNKVRQELKEVFPYRVIDVPGCEADDVIGTLCLEFGTDDFMDGSCPILIVSGDHDFAQLEVHENVERYNPTQKKMEHHPRPRAALMEHVMRGDPGDGIPNVLSPDDTFVLNKRQRPLTEKRMRELIAEYEVAGADPTTEIGRNILRNRELVDLGYTPPDLRKQILASYESQADKKANGLFDYFMRHRLREHTARINDFVY